MSLDVSESPLLAALRAEVLRERHVIFEDLAGCEFRVMRTSLSRPTHRQRLREIQHRILDVEYMTGRGVVGRRKIWLKFCPHTQEIHRLHKGVYDRLPVHQRIFPKPYFCGSFPNEQEFIAMEFVQGSLLRDMVLFRFPCGRSGRLQWTFHEVGSGMRAFHETSPCRDTRAVADLAESARTAIQHSACLSQVEKAGITRKIMQAEQRAKPSTKLPLIRTQNDWVLRNIVVTDDGTPRVVDLDSLRAPFNSRWYDVVYFLVNIESLRKFSPLIRARPLARLFESFWNGYVAPGLPDGLWKEQVTSIIFLTKVEAMLGDHWRPPLIRLHDSFFGRRYIRELKQSVAAARYSTLPLSV